MEENRKYICVMLKSVISEFVDHPEKVQVDYHVGEKTTVFELDIDPADFGKVLGGKGRTISSLRTIVLAITSRKGYRSVINIKDEDRFFK
jgi:predicted RNA-binding protein YlqC (UPF0109 family)